jgi:hypothetical protein
MYRRHVAGIKGITAKYENGVHEFRAFTVEHAISDKIRCSCSKCMNRKLWDPTEVEIHLYRFGFVKDYKRWTCHGEPYYPKDTQTSTGRNDPGMEAGSSNPMREIVLEATGPGFRCGGGSSVSVEEPPDAEAQRLYDMLEAIDTPIWDGCLSHLQLFLVTRLLNIKSEWCFNQVVQLMK